MRVNVGSGVHVSVGIGVALGAGMGVLKMVGRSVGDGAIVSRARVVTTGDAGEKIEVRGGTVGLGGSRVGVARGRKTNTLARKTMTRATALTARTGGEKREDEFVDTTIDAVFGGAAGGITLVDGVG